MNALYILLIGQAILFVFGAIYAMWQTKQTRENEPLPLPIRLILSFSLTGGAVWMWLQDPAVEYRQWVAIGMTLSTLGDLFMAGLIPFGHRLIGGMVAFAIAHCFYVTAFLQTGISWTGFWIGIVAYGLFLIIGWFFFIRNTKKINCLRLVHLFMVCGLVEWHVWHLRYSTQIMECGGYQPLVDFYLSFLILLSV